MNNKQPVKLKDQDKKSKTVNEQLTKQSFF